MDSLEELENQLKELKHKEFMLNMCDHWDNSDFRYSQELNSKIIEVKKKIEELKGNGKN